LEELLRLDLRRAAFLERLNRFTVKAAAPDGTVLLLHNRNTGKLGDLLQPGAVLYYLEGRKSMRRGPQGRS